MRAVLALVALVTFFAGAIFLAVAAHAQLVKAFGVDYANIVAGLGLILLAGMILSVRTLTVKKTPPVLLVETNPAKSSNEVLANLAFTAAFIAARQLFRR